MEALLISACLLGFPCKYDGGSNALPAQTLAALRQHWRLVPVCPEVAGGLPVPRVPSERQGERVVTRDGRDVTAEYRRGAECAVRLAERFGARYALLKARSPSCGPGPIYDGSFTGKLTEKYGITAEYLNENGLIVTESVSGLPIKMIGEKQRKIKNFKA